MEEEEEEVEEIDLENLTQSSNSASIISWPPDFQIREEWEAHYGVLPPLGLDSVIAYTDDELNLFYSTSASESSISSYETVPPEEVSEKGSEESDEEEPKDVEPKKIRNIRVERPVSFAIGGGDEEEVEEEDNIFGDAAVDGNILYTVNDEGIVHDFDDRRNEKKKTKKRRLAKCTVAMRTAEWNYEQQFFTEDPNEYLWHKVNEFIYNTQTRRKQDLSAAETTLDKMRSFL